MSNYTDLISRLNKKTGPINLSEIVELLEEQTLPADALGPGSVASPIGGGPVLADTPFTPFQTIWLLEMVCDNVGAATVTLTGVRRDTGVSETVATYNLSAGETVNDANDRTDHVSFSWFKTGAGNIVAKVL